MTFELIRDLAAGLLAGRSGLFARYVLACVAFTVASASGRLVLGPQALPWWLVAVSLVLIAACSTPTIAAIALAYALLFYAVVELLPAGPLRVGATLALLAAQIAGPILWLPRLSGYGGVREFVAFATNLTFLRSWAWAFDRALVPEARGFRDYAVYTFFFPAFPSGPFFSPSELATRRLGWWWDATPSADVARRARVVALLRIVRGFAGLALLAWVASALTPEAYLRAMHGGPGGAWWHSVGVYLAVYFGFSAWTDAAIGFAALSGLVLPENFDDAHLAYGPADFWRRWNRTLGHWMHEYVYVPLGGAHPGGRRDRLAWWNIAAVFAAVALYHHVGGLKLLGPGVAGMPGFWLPWTLWALINTVGTLVTRRWRAPARWGAGTWAIVVATFAISAAGLATAFYPLGLPIADVLVLYRALLGGGLR